ncbi:hypothetical protein GDO81_028001 [Engystomops pustulosus]|uniref:Uncharacterized protein n=1 Tax=Engystomops pustulosus TaxID=76066 RepID=A0AAV6ZJA3_ENGPU|nr:hypothetical protein GDO81_028001 [Engystomops pustulosus]
MTWHSKSKLVKWEVQKAKFHSFPSHPCCVPSLSIISTYGVLGTRDNPQNDFWGVCLKWHELRKKYTLASMLGIKMITTAQD